VTCGTRSVPQGKEPTVQVFIRHWKYEEPKLFILRTGNEAAGLPHPHTPSHTLTHAGSIVCSCALSSWSCAGACLGAGPPGGVAGFHVCMCKACAAPVTLVSCQPCVP
jgi:hypothetical protein